MAANPPACADRDTPVPPHDGPTHRLGWQGWQINVPIAWNPVRCTGDGRSGALAVADLDAVRLELSWRHIRRADRVDLERVDRSKRLAAVTWTPTVRYPDTHCFAQARTGRDSSGTLQAMVVSRSSKRMLHVQLRPGSDPPMTAGQLPLMIDDHSDRADVPWSIFGMAFSVPAQFELKSCELTAGRLRFVFARRGRQLVFERRMLRDPVAPPAAEDGSGRVHFGHPVTVKQSSIPWWRRLMCGALTISAAWDCPQCQRHFRIVAGGMTDEALLDRVLERVTCHAPSGQAEAGTPEPPRRRPAARASNLHGRHGDARA